MRLIDPSRILDHPARDDDPLRTGALLVALTLLVLGLQSPHTTTGSPAAFLPQLELPTLDHVMEWRPQGPPPWVDGDQMLMDEPEDLPMLSTQRHEAEGTRDPRARPQR
jgi:hypothetical protein